MTLAKVKGTGENAAEKWQVTVTGEGAAATRDADADRGRRPAHKVATLRATTFAAAAPGRARRRC